MDNDIKHVHVGQAIDKRRNELGLSKSEFGRKISIPRQNIKNNYILRLKHTSSMI